VSALAWYYWTLNIFRKTGLAQTAVHKPAYISIIPRSLFQGSNAIATARLTSTMASLTLSPGGISASVDKRPPGVHLFTIMARMLKDPNMKIKKPDSVDGFITAISQSHGKRILEYAELWTLDTSDAKDVEHKIEELIWMNTIIYGIGGWSKTGDFKPDFFLYVGFFYFL
jgi:hypothetical protein